MTRVYKARNQLLVLIIPNISKLQNLISVILQLFKQQRLNERIQ